MDYIRAVPLTGSDQIVANGGPAVYYGIVVRETAAAVASLRVYDGTSAAGVLIDSIALLASEDQSNALTKGIWCANGLFVDILAGTIEGSIRVG